jgi:hypothetical protein
MKIEKLKLKDGLMFDKGCNVKDRKIGVGLFMLSYHVRNEEEKTKRGKKKRRTQSKSKDYILSDSLHHFGYKIHQYIG